MIPAASIQDQELPVRSERTGINHPAVAWRGHLGARPGGHRNAPFGSADAVGSAEIANFHAIRRHRQRALERGEGNGRRQPAGILERREVRAFAALLILGQAGRVARRPWRRCRDPLFQTARSDPSDCPPGVTARAAFCRSLSSAFSVSACCFWRSSISSVMRCRSSDSALRSAVRRVLLGGDVGAQCCTSSVRSVASASALSRISGTTAPSTIALRTDCARLPG